MSMRAPSSPLAVEACSVPSRSVRTVYPEPFGAMFEGRDKKALGTVFGLTNFGVNLSRLAPGAISALRHAHAIQDEFVYILEGHPTLHTNEGPTALAPGMCAGFKAGTGDAHRLTNDSSEDAVYLEIGDRSAGDEATYPDHDLVARESAGAWHFFHKDGRPYLPASTDSAHLPDPPAPNRRVVCDSDLLAMIGTISPVCAGACLCGDVQWASSDGPRQQFNCYCIDCRKSTGAAFVPIMFFKAEHVQITGQLTRFTSRGGSGHAMHRAFCSRCGSQVAAEITLMPGWVSIRAGTLEDINLFAPKASIFVSQASDWSPPRDDLPCFEQLPPNKPPPDVR